MAWEIPYDKFELSAAVNSITDLDGEKFAEFATKLGALTSSEKNRAELNRRVAEYHGIEVVDLVNSPNREALQIEFVKDATKKIVKDAEEEMGLTTIQVWGLIALAADLLE